MAGDPEKVKERLDIVDLIGSYLQLQKAGAANFRARCPFHQEKTPSFYVSKERQMWHCFGCGEGGDHFTFVQKFEHLEFPEALRLLAERAGVKLESYRPEVEDARSRLLAVLKSATLFWQRVLWNEPAGAAARDYLTRRGVDEATARTFAIGYAPEDWGALIAALGREGFRIDEIVRAGLAITRERGGAYDRFRGRVVFPITNHHGHIVGCTARTLRDAPDEPKYVNTPETDVYKKGALLYGLDRAKDAIRKKGYAVLVEGNMDVISSHRIGVTEAIAASGTALTSVQLELLRRFTDTVIIAFDADAAGESAASKSVDLALASRFRVRVLRLPPDAGKDADECISKKPTLWPELIAAAPTFIDDAFLQVGKSTDLATAEGKRRSAAILIRAISKLGEAVERSHYLQRLSSLVDTPENILREELARMSSVAPLTSRTEATAPPMNPQPPIDRETRVAEAFIAALLADPGLVGTAQVMVTPEMLPSDSLRSMFTRMIVWYTGVADSESMPEDELFRRLALSGERDLDGLTTDSRSARVREYAALIRGFYRERERHALARAMFEAEKSHDQDALNRISRRYQELVGSSNSV